MCLDDLLQLLPDQQVLYVWEQNGQDTVTFSNIFIGSVAELKNYPYRDKVACRDMKKICVLNDNGLGVYV